MGAVLSVQHLAVVPPGFFNILAQRSRRLLSFTAPSLDRQMQGLELADLSLLQSDDVALAQHIHLRHFVRQGEPVARRLPVLSVESFNSVPEQRLFALAAVKAGAAGRQAQSDINYLLQGQPGKVSPQRLEKLADKMSTLAALPKTRIRLPSGAQHLLADPVDRLLAQTGALGQKIVEVGLCAYAPKGADLRFPNTPTAGLDREDALGQGGLVATYVQRALIEGQSAVSMALSFSQLAAGQQRGISVRADLAGSRLLPKTELLTRSGAHYLVSNSPEAVELALKRAGGKSQLLGTLQAFM